MTEKNMKKVVVKVDGMSCQGCANEVFYNIKKVGGKNTKVSLKEGTAETCIEDDGQKDKVVDAIKKRGYEVKVIDQKDC